MRSILTFILIFCTFHLFSQPKPENRDKNVIPNIGSRLELFVDSFLIDELKNTRLILHTPQDQGPVLDFDKPWEGPFCGYVTILKDNDKFRLYYRGLPKAGKDGSTAETTCYAESKDGINWTKPNLGIYEVSGTLNNNVVLADHAPFSHNFSPFIDNKPGIPNTERYKAIAGIESTGLLGFKSTDGIHWQKVREEPLITKGQMRGPFDSQNLAFWSTAENRYICYFRSWTTGATRYRTVSRTTSEDFIHWDEPVEMDFGDTPREHLYTNQTSPYFRAPHIYISVAARFMPHRQVLTEDQALELNVNPKYFKDCSDAIFMTTRGGNKYDRTFMEGFIRPGIGLQNWVSRSNYPALNIMQTSPVEMSIYVNQDYAQPSAHLHRYSLRIDGFSSVNAPYDGGELITKPFTFTGDSLILNFSTSAAGFVKVEILDQQGKKIKDFELKNAKELIGNEINKVVTWNENPDLKLFNNKPVRLRFVMKDADIYSLRFK